MGKESFEMTDKKVKKKPNKVPYTFTSFKRDLGAWFLILPALLCIYFFVFRTQILGLYWSFFDMKGFTPTNFVGLDNYARVLKDTAFLKTFKNTVTYVVVSLIIGFPLPFIMALIMNEIVHFRKAIRTLVYLPCVIPAMAMALLWYFVYYPDASGLLNMFLGKLGVEPYGWLQDGRFTILWIVIAMTWNGTGSTSIYYFAGMQGINRELYEAALIDGAGFLRRIRTVTMPHMYGMLILFLIRQIIGVFNVMEIVLQMTDGGPNNASMTLGLLNYRYGFVINKPQFALALGFMMFVFLSVFAYIYFKADKKIQSGQM